MSDTETTEIRLRGISASPGICIGKAYLVDKEGVDVIEKFTIEPERLEEEVNRFKTAVSRAEAELREVIENTPEDLRQSAFILETHLVLLRDKMLYNRTIDSITAEGVNAEWALKKTVAGVKEMFEGMADTYLKERAADIEQVTDRIVHNLIGEKSRNIANIDKRVILVAHDLSPAETSQIQLEKIKGFVTDGGGVASHTSIIAQTLQIPAVLGLGDATKIIRNDDVIVVDGSKGLVIVHPNEATLLEFSERRTAYENRKALIARQSHRPAETIDHVCVPIMGNMELAEEVVSVLDNGGDGIGLYRTEFLYLNRITFPSERELFERYKDVVEVVAPRAVTFRSLDISADKAPSFVKNFQDANPALGLRGIRYCLKKPEVFKTQLRAILRAAAFGRVRIMFPMISHFDEIRKTKRILKAVAEELDKAGATFNPDVEIGILIEVPAAVVMADLLAEEVDFFSIGTNDLIQYTLAIDRENRQVAHLYHPLDPAILRMIKRTADVAHDKGIEVFMCGEMAAKPIHAPVLLGMGIDELSMNPQSIPAVKAVIRTLNAAECRRIIPELLKQTTAKKVVDVIKGAYGHLLDPVA